ncbi:uncharacterized protein KZ484_017898 [Pholidichthys leucotaenia]
MSEKTPLLGETTRHRLNVRVPAAFRVIRPARGTGPTTLANAQTQVVDSLAADSSRLRHLLSPLLHSSSCVQQDAVSQARDPLLTPATVPPARLPGCTACHSAPDAPRSPTDHLHSAHTHSYTPLLLNKAFESNLSLHACSLGQ